MRIRPCPLSAKARLFSLALLLLVAGRVFAMSISYARPQQNYDSDVLLRRYAKALPQDDAFSGLVREKIESGAVPRAVYIHFAGKGSQIYQLFGHVGILLEYDDSDRIFFDWGVFDSSKPGFVDDFVHGNMMYSLSVHTIGYWERTLEAEGRSSRFLKLRMSAMQRRDLQNFLFFNSRRENTDYLYDFFRDNCSTRARDVLNQVYGGRISEEFSALDQGTYRRVIERAVRHLPAIEFLFNFGQGPSQDVPISYFDAMFLPGYLEIGLRRLEVQTGVSALLGHAIIWNAVRDAFSFADRSFSPALPGFAPVLPEPGAVRLRIFQGVVDDVREGDYEVRFPESVVEGENLPPSLAYVFAATAALAILATLGMTAPGSAGHTLRFVSLCVSCVVQFVFGLLSLVLLYFSSFTMHWFVYSNCNLVFVNPFLFVSAYFALRFAFDNARKREFVISHAIVLLLCAFAVVLKLFCRQENLYLIMSFAAHFSFQMALAFCKNGKNDIMGSQEILKVHVRKSPERLFWWRKGWNTGR